MSHLPNTTSLPDQDTACSPSLPPCLSKITTTSPKISGEEKRNLQHEDVWRHCVRQPVEHPGHYYQCTRKWRLENCHPAQISRYKSLEWDKMQSYDLVLLQALQQCLILFQFRASLEIIQPVITPWIMMVIYMIEGVIRSD